MADKYIMDGCKLAWHPDRVSGWLRGERIVPIHIDVGMSKGCNIRCEYCFGVLQGNFYKRGAEKYFKRLDTWLKANPNHNVKLYEDTKDIIEIENIMINS